MSFVISNSFYNSLPFTGFMDKIGVIPKQQFQTVVSDLRKMKAVIDNGGILVIYPAGLMCEDGISTPIPDATYKFLKWLDTDVYVARAEGSYFAMPKWGKGMRAGKTSMDVYKLFEKEELAEASETEVRDKVVEALDFDAYRDQEKRPVRFRHADRISGLEHVLYLCPNCNTEHSMKVRDRNILYCEKCGYAEKSDKYAFLHKVSETGEELRYVSDWSRHIYENLMARVASGEEHGMTLRTDVHMIDPKKHKFVKVGSGRLKLEKDCFKLHIRYESHSADVEIPLANIPTLPFKPGKYLELQHGENIYRCVLDDGRMVMKCINMVKVFYELSHSE